MTKFATMMWAMMWALLLVGAVATSAFAQRPAAFRGLPWGAPPGPADPLEPWSLAPQSVIRPSNPAAVPGAGAGVALTTPGAPSTPPPDRRLDVPPDVSGLYGTDSTAVDATPTVLLQQILIESPQHARQLRDLFDAGVTWSSARQLLKLGAVQEYVREYAVEDLAAEMALEIAALPDSIWSSGYARRGRTMFYQVLARGERSRAQLPALGQGLDAQEKARLTQLKPNLRQPVITGAAEAPREDDYVAAALTKQEPATFPEEATMDGEVTLVVFIGRQGDVSRVEVEKSTSIIFEKAAIEAAQRSEYTSATRNGIPEPSSLRITYPFRVPAQPQPGTQP